MNSPLDLAFISKIGFGAYRISNRSDEHREALTYAIESGCNLIDTSANYTDGESETLIGEVLQNFKREDFFVVSKAGYIQGQNLQVIQELHEQDKAKEDFVAISQELAHSIHPDFLEDQLNRSLERLQTTYLDGLLLHNPEYYFEPEGSTQDEYYARIKKAFRYLEEEAKKGRIRYYGISSNNFPFPETYEKVTNLEKVLEIAKKISPDNHFKLIQFPYNLVETGVEGVHSQGKTLIEIAKENGLMTFGNRPLNAFQGEGLLRLASYPQAEFTLEDMDKKWDEAIKKIEKKWVEQGEKAEELHEVPLLKQISEIWKALPTPDAVNQVFHYHLFPFVAQIWGGDIPPQDAVALFDLYEMAEAKSRELMSKNADHFRKRLIKEGRIRADDYRPFTQIACHTYLEKGVDHVLVGMKKKDYVDDFKLFF